MQMMSSASRVARSAFARTQLRGMAFAIDPMAEFQANGDLKADLKTQVIQQDLAGLAARKQSNPAAKPNDPPLISYARGYKYANLLYRASYSEDSDENTVFRAYYDLEVRARPVDRVMSRGPAAAAASAPRGLGRQELASDPTLAGTLTRPRPRPRPAPPGCAPSPLLSTPQRIHATMQEDAEFDAFVTNKDALNSSDMVDAIDCDETLRGLNICEETHTLLGARAPPPRARGPSPPAARTRAQSPWLPTAS